MSLSQSDLPQYSQQTKGSGHYSSSSKNFTITYDPDKNRNNIYHRKLQKLVPQQNQLFSENPLTKLLQPQDVTKSKRFARDKLNISDIPGVKPDVYKKQRLLEGREYMNNHDIEGTQPQQLKQNKPMSGPDYKLFTKDINPDKWQSKRIVNPLQPHYEVPTKSGRRIRIGPIERNAPKINVSLQTRRIANYVADIEGTIPKKTSAISDEQREKIMSNEMQLSSHQRLQMTRNNISSSIHQESTPTQDQVLKQAQSFDGSNYPPKSHYARFQTYQVTLSDPLDQKNTQQVIQAGQSQLTSLQSIVPQEQNDGLPRFNNRNLSQDQLPPRSQYRQMIGSSHFNSLKQSLGGNQINEESPLGLNTNGQEDQRQNNYKLMIQKPTINSSFVAGNGNGEYNLNTGANSIQSSPLMEGPGSFIKSEYYKTKNANGKSDIQMQQQQQYFNESPSIQNRAWSKAKNMGGEVVSQNLDMRISSSNKSYTPVQNNLIDKANFQNSIFQRGQHLNSKHTSYQSTMIGQVNPINNEVNRSFDVQAKNHQYFNNASLIQQKAQNPNNIQVSNPIIGMNGQQSSSITRIQDNSFSNNKTSNNVMPPTTSKMYGNFFDANKLDQMIRDLKSSNLGNGSPAIKNNSLSKIF